MTNSHNLQKTFNANTMSTKNRKEKLFYRKGPNQIFCILIKNQGAIHIADFTTYLSPQQDIQTEQK